MKLSYATTSLKSMKADALVVFVAQDPAALKSGLAPVRKLLGKRLDAAIALERFDGSASQLLVIHTERKLASPRLCLVGIGKPARLSTEVYRRAAAAGAKYARGAKLKHLACVLPSPAGGGIAPDEAVTALAEGMLLSLYKYDKYMTAADERNVKLTDIVILEPAGKNDKAAKEALRRAKIVCEAVCLARDLENAPGNELYPETLAEAARASAERHGYRAVVWDKKRIDQAGFGGLAAVNAGSTRPPRFIILEHNGGRKGLETIVLVGKGVTFDSGGISIKPSAGMAEMKMDMSGAAAVIGTMEAATRLNIPLHLVGLIPATENMPGGNAMRPGDIVTHYGGTTSEVDNTDAEGRLILADALAYAKQYNPAAVIDLATLTGACVVALGAHATGMMGNDDRVMGRLRAAGLATYERVWELPLYEEYEKQIKSDVADVKNVGGRWAGAITAALFLKKFVDKYPWVHLDIAGTAILEESLPYTPKGGSGVGVRLLIRFLQEWNSATEADAR
jgi:leucyl aminopeptidase